MLRSSKNKRVLYQKRARTALFWYDKGMRYITALIVAGILCSPMAVLAETVNAGFVQGNIWYSKDPFFSGDTVRIYTGVFNGGSSDILGVVEFKDNGIALDRIPFTVTGGGRLREVWTDWRATEGSHSITAHIVEAKIARVGAQPEPIVLAHAGTSKDDRVIDLDTDKDGIGNAVDKDDDNDGTEDAQDSQPLVATLPDKTPKTVASTQGTVGESAEQVAQTVLGSVNSFAAKQADTLEEIKERLDVEVAELKAKEQKTTGSGALATEDDANRINEAAGVPVASTTPSINTSLKRFGKQMYSWGLGAAIYILRTPWLLYLVLALMVVWIFRRWRRHQWEKRG